MRSYITNSLDIAFSPYDGSGNYVRVTDWTSDRDAGIKILADRHDTQDDDFAAALTNVITRNGQSQVTADIPFNSKKITGLADPVNPQDAANKRYADSIRAFSAALEVSGSAAQARIKFTGATGPWGFEFPTADLSFGVKNAVDGGAPTRFVWNEKPDLSGQDIMVLNAGATVQLGLGLAPPLAGNSGIFAGLVTTDETYAINAYFNNADSKWHFLTPGFATLITQTKATGVMAIYRSTVTGVADAVITWANLATWAADGQVTFPSNVNAGSAIFHTNANVTGSAWLGYGTGHSDAYNAIYNRIETRCTDYRNTVVNNTRSAGYLGYAGSGGAGAYFENAGYFMTAVQKVSGDSYNMYFRQPQVNIPQYGWIAAFPW